MEFNVCVYGIRRWRIKKENARAVFRKKEWFFSFLTSTCPAVLWAKWKIFSSLNYRTPETNNQQHWIASIVCSSRKFTSCLRRSLTTRVMLPQIVVHKLINSRYHGLTRITPRAVTTHSHVMNYFASNIVFKLQRPTECWKPLMVTKIAHTRIHTNIDSAQQTQRMLIFFVCNFLLFRDMNEKYLLFFTNTIYFILFHAHSIAWFAESHTHTHWTRIWIHGTRSFEDLCVCIFIFVVFLVCFGRTE